MQRRMPRSRVLAVLVLTLAALFTAPVAQAAPVLLSQGRPVTASSSESAAFPALPSTAADA
ncbi:licheninase, partial [Amycolatopsis plumensis]